MAKSQVVLSDFSGGDYGRSWPGLNSEKHYRAVNVIPYPNGSIGPRPPLVPLNVQVDSGPSTSMGNFPNTAVVLAHNDLVLTRNGRMWNILTGERSNNQPPEGVGIISKPELVRDFTENWYGELTLITEDADEQPAGHISIQHDGEANTRPTYLVRPDAPSGNRIEQFADVFVAAWLREFHWSDPLTFSGWGADNFAQAPQTQMIYDIIRQRNTLVMMVGSYPVPSSTPAGFLYGVRGTKRSGINIYIITGVLGHNAVLRRVTSGTAPSDAKFGAHMESINGEVIYWFNDRWMMTFDGAEITTHDAPLPRLLHSPANFLYGPNLAVPFWSSALGKFQNEFVLSTSVGYNGGSESATPSPYRRRGLFVWQHGQQGGGWTAHDPGIEFRAEGSADRPGIDLAHRGVSDFHVYGRGETDLIFVTQGRTTSDGNGTPQAPRFYKMSLADSFPDTTANDGDTAAPVKADWRSADYWEPDGGESFVRSVVIDYSYTAGGAAQALTVGVEALQLWDNAQPVASGTQTLVPSGGSPSEPGTQVVRGRHRFAFGDQGAGNGFRIRISDWQGILIHRIVVDVDVTPPRG